MESTPEEVFRSYEIKDLSKKSAVEMLISFVESSDDDLLRVNSIKLISKLDPKNQNLYGFFENLFISDLNESVRIAAFKAIKKNFYLKALAPVKYAIQHENGSFLLTLVNFLSNTHPFICKNLLKTKIKKLYKNNQDFLELEKNPKNFNNLSLRKLKMLLFNYILNTSLDSLYFHRHSIPIALDFYGID